MSLQAFVVWREHAWGGLQFLRIHGKGIPWLLGFMLSQLALMVIAGLPLARWRSFSAGVKDSWMRSGILMR